MKPIFKQEREFLNTKLGIDLPNDCWRNGSKVYLNHFDDKPSGNSNIRGANIKQAGKNRDI